MEKKLDLEDTVRAVTEQPWARIRAFMKPVIPALAAVLIAALAAGCTMMDSVPQETPASEVEPPEALIAARVEDAEPADEQLKTPVEQAGASVLSDSEQAAFCAYLLDKFDELEVRGAFDAESRWTAERLSDTVACLTIYRPDAQDEVLDELIITERQDLSATRGSAAIRHLSETTRRRMSEHTRTMRCSAASIRRSPSSALRTIWTGITASFPLSGCGAMTRSGRSP